MSAVWFERNTGALPELEEMLRARFPTLHAFIEDGYCHVRGTYALQTGARVFDRYQIEVLLPNDYPSRLPRVWETAGRIPRVSAS